MLGFRHVERVLDVEQSERCWLIGTIYMDLEKKPNVLKELAVDVRIYVCDV